MSQSGKVRKHVLVDRIPIIVAIVLMEVVSTVPSIVTSTLVEEAFVAINHVDMTEYIMAGNDIPAGVMNSFFASTILCALLILLLFELWFRPEYEGSMRGKGMGAGMKFLAPVFIFWILWYVIQVVIGTGYFDVPKFGTILQGFRPGVLEEVAYRGLGMAILLRKFRDSKNILLPTIISSVFFGITHLMNMINGGDPFEVIVTVVFATMYGVIFGLAFTYCGCIWPTILLHGMYDTTTFMYTGLGDGFAWTNVVDVVGLFVLMLVVIWCFMKNKEHAVALWQEKWKVPAAQTARGEEM